MKPLPILAAFALLATACGSSSSTATSPTSANPNRLIFTASLSPANEVPPVTNAESVVTGSATITIDVTRDSSGNITSSIYTFAVTLGSFPAGSAVNIAHIHEGSVTCACPVVVSTGLAPGDVTISGGLASFTKVVNGADPAIAQRISANPAGFYFNVHTAMNPGGVARGILVKSQ
jgi:CHRD domain